MKIAVGLLALLFVSSAFAQTPPKVRKKPAVQAKPHAPMGCKLVGTVRGTKIWAGDCAAAPETGAAPAGEPESPTAAPTDKQ